LVLRISSRAGYVGKTKQWCGNSYSNLGRRIV
jgi:hypothetical protein